MPISDSFVLSSSCPAPSVPSGSFIDLVYENFDTFPDRTAIVDDASGKRITFADLKRITARVASGLAKRGFGKGHVLSLFGANCIENAPVAHGAIVAGGTIHLVKPVASQDELRFHFNLVSPKIVVTTASSAEAVREAVRAAAPHVQDIYVIGAAVDGCRRVEELLEDPGDANPWGNVDIDPRKDVAMLMLTGGTTGMSKTVMITHEVAKLSTLEAFDHLNGCQERDMCIGYIPFSHGFSFLLSYSCYLRLGCGVVIVAGFHPETILRTIEKHKVTRMAITPMAIKALIASPYFPEANLTSLQELQISGASMSSTAEELIRKAFDKTSSGVNIDHSYGMTELAGGVCWYPLPFHADVKRKLGSSGVVQPSVELRVVSCHGQERQPCQAGQRGQILLRSPRLFKGYFKDEETTRKAFIDGWYDTGDYGYFDEDGFVFVIDRIKDLIFHNDGMIVPSYVEGVLCSHPSISDCAVVGRRSDDSSGAVAMAFVVKKEGCDITEGDVHRFAEERLSAHEQLTGGIRFVASIPKSPAGKMLRRLLIEKMEEDLC